MSASLLALALLVQEPPVRLPLKWRSGAEETAELLEHDAAGMKVRLAGVDYPVWVAFDDLDPRTVEATRRRLPGAAPSGGRRVAGLRVRLADGLVEGVELPSTDPALLRLKTAAGERTIRRADVRSAEPVEIDARVAYTEREILDELLKRHRPTRPEQWEALALELGRAGLGARAREAWRAAGLLREPPGPERGLAEALARLAAGLPEGPAREAAARLVEAAASGDYDAALAEVNRLEGAAPAEELGRVKGEIVRRRGASREARLQAEWARAVEDALLELALDASVGLEAAEARLDDRLMKQAEGRVAERLGFTPGDPAVADAWARRPAGARLMHSYGASTFLAGAPTTGRAQEWWSRAAPDEKMAYLKGRHIERHRTVVRAEAKNCPTCGARGTIRGGAAGAPVLCPGCFGAREFRILIYR